MTLDPSSPVVIGGVGGSGTRVVTQLLIDMGYYMGTHNNSAHDSLWFRFFLKRPEWFHYAEEHHPESIHRALDLMQRNLTSPYRPTRDDLRFIRDAVGEQGWRGVKRAVKLFTPRPLDYDAFEGWGWKEPSTHVFLDYLYRHFSGMKYIHTIRHGLDMAYTGKLSQIRDWAARYHIDLPSEEENISTTLLDFWIQANRLAIEWRDRIGPDRFYLLNFDQLCDTPREEIINLAAFLQRDLEPGILDALAAIPRTPSSRNRYRTQDWRALGEDRIRAVEAFGFPVGDGSSAGGPAAPEI